MIRYKCTKCGVSLESPSTLGGEQDKCPQCGALCDVPDTHKSRKLALLLGLPLVGLLLGGGLIAYVLLRGPTGKEKGPNEARAPGSTTSQSRTREISFHLLEKRVGRDAAGGYYVWIVVPPLTRSELQLLGNDLVGATRRAGADHLKAFLYYDHRDYSSGLGFAIFLNAVGPKFKLSISGPVPTNHSKRACFQAYVQNYPMSSEADNKGCIRCEYAEDTDTLTYHDRWAGAFSERLSIQDVVLQLGHEYLPSEMNPNPWSTIPGLREVVVHFYEKGAAEPALTVSYGRWAYERAVTLSHALWKERIEVDKAESDALRRERALVITPKELKAVQTMVAQQIYNLYEDMWVELRPLVQVQAHKQLPRASPERLRRYFF